jgi:hypothetical protein
MCDVTDRDEIPSQATQKGRGVHGKMAMALQGSMAW